MKNLWHDLAGTLRILARAPLPATAIVVVLALGIGANAAMFSVVDGVLLQPLPYHESDRLAVVSSSSPTQGATGPMAQEDFLRLRESSQSFEKSAVYRAFNASLMSDPASSLPAESLAAALVSADLFAVLHAPALHGRTFLAGEDRPGAAPVVVIGEKLWKRRYGASAAILGKPVNFDGTLYTVVGVMPASFEFPQKGVEIWTPITFEPHAGRGPVFLRTLVRLKPHVTLEQARAELDGIRSGLARELPQWYKNVSFPIVSLQDSVVGNTAQTLWIVQGVVAVVLLIAIANLANLMLARTAARQHEVTIRRCLGASRGGLLRQFLTESIALSLVGGVGAIAVADGVIRYLQQHPSRIPRVESIQLDATAWGLAMMLAMMCGVIFGLVPSVYGAGIELGGALKSGGRGTTLNRSATLLQRGLIVSQVCLCFVLLIGAGLLTKSAERLGAVDLGFDARASELLTLHVYPTGVDFTPERRTAVYQEIVKRTQGLPGVQSAAVSASLPPERWSYRQNFQIEGRAFDPLAPTPNVTIPTSTPEYFNTLGVPLLQGRLFTDADDVKAPPVAIISETMARRYFPNENPIGKRIKRGGPTSTRPYMEIVGVVGDVKYTGLRGEPEAVFYNPLSQDVPLYGAYLVVRGPNPSALVNTIRHEIQAVHADTGISRISTIADLIGEQSAQVRFSRIVMSTFATLSLLLATVGIYSLVSQSVVRRTAEIGIRAALGATRRNILTGILAESASLGVIGLLLGGAAATLVTRFVKTLLFAVSANDISNVVTVGAILIGTLLLAGYIPARRATTIDPAIVLRDGTRV